MSASPTIGLRGELLEVRRGADIDDHRWRTLRSQLAGLTVESDRERILVDGADVGRLRAALGDWPSAEVAWQWTPAAADHLEAHEVRAAAIRRLVRQGDDTVGALPSEEELGVARKLTPPQRRDAALLVDRQNGANFSVPGAGKTTTMLVVWRALRLAGVVDRLLVVAPPSAFEAWANEPALVFHPEVTPHVQIRPSTAPSSTTDIVVVNYEQLERLRTRSHYVEWVGAHRAAVVFDESHRIKSGRAGVRGAAARQLTRSARRVFVLTGTPMPRSKDDLAAQLDLCWPGFGHRLATGDLSGQLDRFYVRTTKDELEVPRLTLRTLRVDLAPAHRQRYDAHLHDGIAAEHAGPAIMHLLAGATNPDLLPSARGDTVPAAKLDTAAALVRRNAAEGKKTLVWSSFVDNVRELGRRLEDLRPAVVVGDVPVHAPDEDDDRVRQLIKFREDPDCHVLIATPHTLGEGVSLHQVCRDQVHLDRTFSAGLFLQSLDRTHRLGMSHDAPVTATVLVAAGTIDEQVDEVLRRRVAAMAAVLNDRALHVLSTGSHDADVDELTNALREHLRERGLVRDVPPA